MKKAVSKIFKILGLICMILFVVPVIILTALHLKAQHDYECQPGPLGQISECNFHQSMFSWMNGGSWYSDATGTLDQASCKVVTEGEDKLSFPQKQGGKIATISVYKISCETLGQDIKGVCYASQSMTGNGNTRYAKIVIADECKTARYFEGSKYIIRDGEVEGVTKDWVTPYKDIPDETTGKVEPIKVYGENTRKSPLSRRG